MSDDVEIRRRRAVALAALFAGLLLLVLAVVSAFSGSDGDDERRPAAAATTATATTPERGRQARRPRGPALRRGPAVAASAPGAHKAPRESVPVLAYHFINAPQPGSDPALWVPREVFDAQMRALEERDYHPVTLQQVWDAWHEGGLLPSKPVVISFEDGYHSHYANALPVLRERRWPAVLFLRVEQLRDELGDDDVREMIRAGWELGSHTVANPDLTTVDEVTLDGEVAGSRRTLQRRFGVTVNFLAYPDGRADDRVAAAARDAGYLGAVTTQPGLASPGDDPFALRRVVVGGSDDVDGLLARLDALGGGQPE